MSVKQKIRKYKVRNLTKERRLLQVVIRRSSETEDEWFALNIIDQYEKFNKFYSLVRGTMSEKKSMMVVGDHVKVHWMDEESYQSPTLLTSEKFISLTLNQAGKNISDPEVIPERDPFPEMFRVVGSEIWCKLFVCYSYIFLDDELLQELKIFKMDEILKTCFMSIVRKTLFEFSDILISSKGKKNVIEFILPIIPLLHKYIPAGFKIGMTKFLSCHDVDLVERVQFFQAKLGKYENNCVSVVISSGPEILAWKPLFSL